MNAQKISLLLLLLFLSGSLYAGNPLVVMNDIGPVIKGENARIEFNMTGFEKDIYEARLFYRSLGDVDYKSIPMKNSGFGYYKDLTTQNLSPGIIQYYIAMQGMDGTVYSYPAANPEENPLTFKLVATRRLESPAYQAREELVVLSPEPGEVVPQDELLIAVSVPNTNSNMDPARTRMLIDGVNVSSLMERDDNVFLLSPKSIYTGLHNAEIKIFDSSGNLLGKKEWSFRVSSGEQPQGGFTHRTTVFADNRFQNIAKQSDNFFRGGATFTGRYNNFRFGLRALFSNTQGFSNQDANRFSAQMAYAFTPRTQIYLKGGDYTGNYGSLTFFNQRVFGFSAGLQSPYFDLDVSAGTSANAVEGEAAINGTDTTITRFATYKRTFLAIRPLVKFGQHVSWGLDLVNGKDDPGSVKFGANPTEALVMGSTLRMNFDNSRIRFLGSVQASIANNNARGAVDFDTLANRYDLTGSTKDLAQKFVNFMESTGFLTLSQGLAPLPNLAFQFDTYLNYFNNNFRLTYKSIDPNYVTPGNPYLLKGIRGLFINDNIRLADNQVFLNLFFKSYTDNLIQEDAATSNTHIGASLSYFPLSNFPGITLTFANQARSNNADTTNTALYAEDNTTQRLSVSSSYAFQTGPVKNTATVSFSNFNRDDKILATNQSRFNVISLAIRNNFDSPLVTRFGFSKNTTAFGADASKVENDISRYSGGVEYEFTTNAGRIRPFVSTNFQQIKNAAQDYSRINYSGGIYINTNTYGNLSLRFDYIDYSSLNTVDWKDTIFSTRYDVSF